MKNIKFVNTHALPRKFSKERKERAELEKKMQEKVESPLPTMKLEPTITESKPNKANEAKTA